MDATQFLNDDHLLLKCYAGSHSYGTNVPTSDVDFRGIFCADEINIRTPFFPVREVDDTTEEDTKYFELTHFLNLYLKCNPNIVELLWVDHSDIVHASPAYEILRKYRTDMLSSKIAFTTSGYAISQLKRIRGHNKWISNPQPKESPQPKDHITVVQWFGKYQDLHCDVAQLRNDHRLIPYGGDIFGVYPEPGKQLWADAGSLNALFEGERSDYDFPIAIIKYNKEEYRRSKEIHEQYWNWKTNRNKARGALEEQFGYDSKHAMHLVRLLRMGIEALRDGEILVKRHDAQELLDIRNGAWT